jgi:ubiquitin-like-conjugating enzyme ATG3
MADDDREPTTLRKVIGLFHSAREALNPILKESKFKETGVLTPEEFVLAGDFLVYKFPTWQWVSGLESKRKDYLPPNKQYLITRNVPCLKRVKDMEYQEAGDEVGEGGQLLAEDQEWVKTHSGHPEQTPVDVKDFEELEDSTNRIKLHEPMTGLQEKVMPNFEDIPDMEDELESILQEQEDPGSLLPPPPDAKTSESKDEDHILKTR